jgi:hypothetical protein
MSEAEKVHGPLVIGSQSLSSTSIHKSNDVAPALGLQIVFERREIMYTKQPSFVPSEFAVVFVTDSIDLIAASNFLIWVPAFLSPHHPLFLQ